MSGLSKWYDFEYEFAGKIPDKKFSLDFPRDAPIAAVLKSLEEQGLHFRYKRWIKEIIILP
jgi:hypothetical protein